DIYGWEWIPGYDWAPAWVYWGQYNNYYGWAPMPPNAGYGYQPPMNQWCFVPQQNINQVNIVNNNTTIINNNTTVNNITIINNTNTYNNQIYQSGPKKEDVEKVTGLKVPEVVVNDVKSSKDVKADGNIITIYRPSIDKGSSTVKPAPKKVETLENIKPIKDRPVTTTTKDKKTEVATAKEKTTTISKDNEVAPVKEKTNTISKYNETAPTKAPNTNIPKSNEVSPAVKEKTKTNSKENEVAPAKTNISKDKDKQVAPVKVKNAANIKNTKESTLKEKTTKSNKKLKKD
ncbi:MAG: hypothetical protein HGB12_13760, partial [Bacteroidetes bacterium]|nr:hypothetical protein [Bacteroidota bacterium]